MLPPLFFSLGLPTNLAIFWRAHIRRETVQGESHKEPRSFLILRLDSLGDVVLTTPLFRALKRAHPKARCTVVVQAAYKPLLVTNPHIDEILTTPELAPGWWPQRLRNLLQALFLYWRQLRFRHFDFAVSPRWDVDEHLATLLCVLTNAEHRVAYSSSASTAKRQINRGFDRAYDICLPAGRLRHEVLRNLAIAEALGATNCEDHLELHVTEQDRRNAIRRLGSVPGGTTVIALGIGARSRGRRWPLNSYAEAIRHLAHNRRVLPVILCSRAEQEQAGKLAGLLPQPPIVVSGVPLREVCALLERCDLFLGNDSGCAHLSAAMNCRTVVVSRHPAHGDPNHANSPVRFGPYGSYVRVLQPSAGLDDCTDACRSAEAHCITTVAPEQVAAAAEQLLGLKRSTASPSPLGVGGSGVATFASDAFVRRHSASGGDYLPATRETLAVRTGWQGMIRNPRLQRTFKAVWSGAGARLLTSAVSLLSLPLAVRYLGAERYGVWATITTTAVWINLLDLGIASTLSNEISRAFALSDKRAAATSFTNALVLTAAVTLAIGAVFAIVFPRVPWVGLFNVGSGVSAHEVNATVAVAAALMLVALPCNLAGKVLAGYQELHRYNYGVATGAIASLAGLAIGMRLRVPMPALYMMSLGCVTFATAGMLFFVIWQKPWLLPRPKLLNFACARSLLSCGSSFLLIQVAAVVVFSSDNLIVSHYLGAAQVTPYNVTWRIAGVGALLQSLIFPAVWPAYAEAYAKGEYAWIRRTFAATMLSVVVMTLLCAAGMVSFGRSLIGLLMGAAAVPSRPLLWAMSAWVVVNGFMNVESCLLAALNRIREQAALSIVAAGANVALSIALVRHVGAVGVIGGTLISYLAMLVVPQSLIVRNVWRRELADLPCLRQPKVDLTTVIAGD